MHNFFINKIFLKPASTTMFALITLVIATPVYSDPIADVDVSIQYLPDGGIPVEDSASSQVSSGTTTEEVVYTDYTQRTASASATTGSDGDAKAYAQVDTRPVTNPGGDYDDIHRAESTATFVVPWIVESNNPAYNIGDVIDEGVYIDLSIHAELRLDFDTYQQRTCDDLTNPICPFEMGDSISAEGTLDSIAEAYIDLTIGDPDDPDELYSLHAYLESDGDNLCVDDGSTTCGDFSSDSSITNLSGIIGTDGLYAYEIDKLVSIELDGLVVGDEFELTLSAKAIADLEGKTDSYGSLLDITATTDLSNTASYSWSSDIDGLSFVAQSAVPLPAAAWLFGSALLGLGVAKRKRA